MQSQMICTGNNWYWNDSPGIFLMEQISLKLMLNVQEFVKQGGSVAWAQHLAGNVLYFLGISFLILSYLIFKFFCVKHNYIDQLLQQNECAHLVFQIVYTEF